MVIPETEQEEGTVFGFDQKVEPLEGYDATFNQSDAFYEVLTVCIYEKYDLGKRFPLAGPPSYLFPLYMQLRPMQLSHLSPRFSSRCPAGPSVITSGSLPINREIAFLGLYLIRHPYIFAFTCLYLS
ncbi:hypothetical protein OSTOST_08112 [Ostertagia ostertagi]